MIRRTAIAAVAALSLSACGGGQVSEGKDGPKLPSTDAVASATASPTPTEPTGPRRNERNNIVKAFGEEGGITDSATNTLVVTFAVDSIAPVECTNQFASDYPPQNGVLIALQMRFATAPELARSSLSYFSVNPNEFQFIGANGLTVSNLATTATYSCLNDGAMLTTSQMMPGSQYAGAIVLDVPEATGTIIYRSLSVSDGGGWEWKF